jgi:hypothetical protein
MDRNSGQWLRPPMKDPPNKVGQRVNESVGQTSAFAARVAWPSPAASSSTVPVRVSSSRHVWRRDAALTRRRGRPRYAKLPNEAMRSARRFQVPSLRFKVSRLCEICAICGPSFSSFPSAHTTESDRIRPLNHLRELNVPGLRLNAIFTKRTQIMSPRQGSMYYGGRLPRASLRFALIILPSLQDSRIVGANFAKRTHALGVPFKVCSPRPPRLRVNAVFTKRTHFGKRQDEQGEQDGETGFTKRTHCSIASFVCIRDSTENYQTKPFRPSLPLLPSVQTWKLPNEPNLCGSQISDCSGSAVPDRCYRKSPNEPTAPKVDKKRQPHC